MKMVKCLPEFEYFIVFLKNRNFISEIRRSKVTDYAALRTCLPISGKKCLYCLPKDHYISILNKKYLYCLPKYQYTGIQNEND